MRSQFSSISLLAAVSLSLAACTSYIKRDEYDATVQELRAADRNLQSQIDALRGDLEVRFGDYDARFTQLQGRLRVDMTTHFEFDSAELRGQDRPVLDDFARVIGEYHPDVLVTVEGFADPAGSTGYNERLGQRRADAVRDYLVSQGLRGDRIRAVSYGEAPNRQVVPGGWGPDGEPNRRVALVIDFRGAG